VETCEGVLDGSVKAFVGLGGNFVRAVPERERIEAAWTKLRLTVQIATKLNRSHLVHGEIAYLLPCLGRIEIDRQNGVEQAVSMEDSTGAMHGSRGQAEPASDTLRSEPAIVAGLAKALLPPNPRVPWDAWVADYAQVREQIANVYPEIFHHFEARMWTPGGFHRPSPPRELQWKTKNGKANFLFREQLEEDDDIRVWRTDGVLRLTTVRSFDQFNTTIYGYHDRFRGIHGTRHILMMNRADMERRGLLEGSIVHATTVADDMERTVTGLRVVPYDIPQGCVAGYYPELNPLVPLWHHAIGSKVPGYKSVPIRVASAGQA
jgi:molybdopterin-dependent oxidoreductase alpha subunit